MIMELKLKSGKNESTNDVLGFKRISILDTVHKFEIGNQPIEPNKPYEYGLPLVIAVLDEGINDLMVKAELFMNILYPIEITLELYGGMILEFMISKNNGIFWYGQLTASKSVINRHETVIEPDTDESQLLIDALADILRSVVTDPEKRRRLIEQIDNAILVRDARNVKVRQTPNDEVEYSVSKER